jgi:hypothetical protein
MRRIPLNALPLVAALLWVPVGRCAGLELPAEMVEGLKSEKFAERESAEAELLKWSRQQAEAAMDELYRQSRAADNPEVRERCLSILRELINEEYLRNGVGYLGVRMNPLTEGVVVPGEDKARFAIRLIQVEAGTPANKAGLIAGVLLLGVNDRAWRQEDTSEMVSDVIQGYKAGTEVTIKLFRAGNIVEIPVVLGRRPAAADLPQMLWPGIRPDPGLAEAMENQAREAYLRRWFARKKEANK